jgi:hypothetical protein
MATWLDALDAFLLKLLPQHVAIEIGGELPRLGIRDPRDAVFLGRGNRRPALRLDVRARRDEHQHAVGLRRRGGRDVVEVHAGRLSRHAHLHSRLEVQLFRQTHAKPPRGVDVRSALGHDRGR